MDGIIGIRDNPCICEWINIEQNGYLLHDYVLFICSKFTCQNHKTKEQNIFINWYNWRMLNVQPCDLNMASLLVWCSAIYLMAMSKEFIKETMYG